MDKRIVKTKLALQDALLKLVSKKHIGEITVSELCTLAHVNRTTFYKYYSLPADIITEMVNDIYEYAVEQFTQPKADKNDDTLDGKVLQICELYYKNRHIMQFYIQLGSDVIPLMQKFIDNIFPQHSAERITTYFIAGGMSAALVQWYLQDFKPSPSEIAQILTAHIRKLTQP